MVVALLVGTSIILSGCSSGGGSAEPASIIENLEKTTGLEVLSGQLTIDPDTHNPVNKPASILTVKNGEIVYFKTYETTD